MTKKDFIAIAAIMAQYAPGSNPNTDRYTWNNLYNSLADHFERDNPRFDRGRFFRACVYGSAVNPDNIL
jgi:hypothetical protein